MELTMLKGKIHRATVTQAELDYVGSITIDTALLKASGILEYEKVQIVDVNNGQRFETPEKKIRALYALTVRRQGVFKRVIKLLLWHTAI